MPIPTPWIRAYDVPGEFGKGYGLGLQTEQFNVRAQMELDQAAERTALARMELDTRQRQIDQQAKLEQARIAVSQAYHEATISMQKERLAEAQRAMKIKTDQAALQMQEIAAFQREVDAGVPESKAALRHPFMLGPTMSGFGPLARTRAVAELPAGGMATSPVLDPLTGKPMPGVFGALSASGAVIPHNIPGYRSEEQKASEIGKIRLSRTQRQLDAVNKALAPFPEGGPEDPNPYYDSLIKKKRRLESQIDEAERYVLGTEDVPLDEEEDVTEDWTEVPGLKGIRVRQKK